jgi:hypothetical protein
LPNSSHFSSNASLQQDFPLWGSVTAFAGGSVSYVGGRASVFQGTTRTGVPLPRQDFPAYAKTDLRAGVKGDSWTANFFVTNIADRRGVLNGGFGNFPPFGFTYIRPRTIGLSVTKMF